MSTDPRRSLRLIPATRSDTRPDQGDGRTIAAPLFACRRPHSNGVRGILVF